MAVNPKEYYEWTCPECGLEIKSFNKKQFDWNKDNHINKHKNIKKSGGVDKKNESNNKRRVS